LKNNSHGISLIEILVGVILVGIIIIIIARMYISNQQQIKIQQDILNIQQDLKHSIDILNSQLRNVGYNTTGVAMTKVVKAQADTFQFNWCGNPSNPTQVNLVTIRYNNGTMLINSETTTVNIDSFKFTYFDKNNLVTSATGSVRKIKAFIRIRTPSKDPKWKMDGGYHKRFMEAEISPLNLAIN